MRDKNRIDKILTDLGEYWKEHPDLRLCQLITNLVGDNNYNVEDDILSETLNAVHCKKEYVFNCKEDGCENDYLTIKPNFKAYNKKNVETPICFSISNDDFDEGVIGITKYQAKEMIKGLQEIVDCIEGE